MARVSLLSCLWPQVGCLTLRKAIVFPGSPIHTHSPCSRTPSLYSGEEVVTAPEPFIPCVMIHPFFVHTTCKERNIFIKNFSITSFERTICFCQNANMARVWPIRIKSKQLSYRVLKISHKHYISSNLLFLYSQQTTYISETLAAFISEPFNVLMKIYLLLSASL